MSLTRKGKKGIWHIRFTDSNGVRVQCSARTTDRRLAQQYHDQFKAELWKQGKLGKKPRRRWEEATLRWLRETRHKASQKDDIRFLRWLNTYLAGKYLDEITRDLMDNVLAARQAEGVSNATINRTIQPVRAILRKAHREWRWIDHVPTIRFLPEPKRRVRWLTKGEAERLLEELPEHLAEMTRFSLATGLRESNVTGLEWSQVDLNRRVAWIHPDQAKARRAIPVPLNGGALAVLRRQAGTHPIHVFTYKDQPVAKAGRAAWKKALARAGIKDFRWHDLRHTWASWHVQAGTPLNVLQELGAWESVEMVQRYAHLSASHLAEYAERIDTGSNLVQLEQEVA